MIRRDIGVEEQIEATRLVETAWAVTTAARSRTSDLGESERQLSDVSGLGVAGAAVLNDALDAAFTATRPAPTPLLTTYVRQSERSIHETAGYYGPDAAHPLADSPLYRPSAGRPLAVVDEIDGLIASTELWSYDAWHRSWRGRPRPVDPPPGTLVDLTDMSRTIDADIRGRLALVFDAAVEDADADAGDAGRRALLEGMASLVLASVLAAVVAVAAVRVVRRVRATEALVGTDRLTGVGNRHALHRHTAVLLADRSYEMHVVAMIDLDRFKIVNDTWGHAVGDWVLREIAAELEHVVADHDRLGDGAGSVIRLGGDEFLLTLHAKRRIDPVQLTQRLDAIRARTIEPVAGERLALSFSLGIAVVEGPCDVDDVVRAADLAAYDDKATRAPCLVDRRRGFAPPSADAVAVAEPSRID